MKIGNNGKLVLSPFDESTPFLMIVLMNCQTKLRINHLTAVKLVTILERTKLPVRLINTTNERGLVQGHVTPLRVKGDIEDVSSELNNGVKGCTWMKCPEFYRSRRVGIE
ncbi:hypothetical protein TNCV_3758501 [Trichonephila clavipes]|nr:hypothetical protein TNCV_3758501 [Trichonephila clavipes]